MAGSPGGMRPGENGPMNRPMDGAGPASNDHMAGNGQGPAEPESHGQGYAEPEGQGRGNAEPKGQGRSYAEPEMGGRGYAEPEMGGPGGRQGNQMGPGYGGGNFQFSLNMLMNMGGMQGPNPGMNQPPPRPMANQGGQMRPNNENYPEPEYGRGKGMKGNGMGGGQGNGDNKGMGKPEPEPEAEEKHAFPYICNVTDINSGSSVTRMCPPNHHCGGYGGFHQGNWTMQFCRRMKEEKKASPYDYPWVDAMGKAEDMDDDMGDDMDDDMDDE